MVKCGVLFEVRTGFLNIIQTSFVFVVVEWLTLLPFIREVPGSNLGPDTSYLDLCFRGFSQYLQAYAGIVT
jgi:hypothetical protein